MAGLCGLTKAHLRLVHLEPNLALMPNCCLCIAWPKICLYVSERCIGLETIEFQSPRNAVKRQYLLSLQTLRGLRNYIVSSSSFVVLFFNREEKNFCPRREKAELNDCLQCCELLALHGKHTADATMPNSF